ncbi:MAG: site-specific integrase [Pseudomonadota bacterium]
MPKSFLRIKTKYPGVYYIESKGIVTGRPERIYYIRYRKAGKAIDEKVGRQFQDDMTPAKAARIRAQKIEGNQTSNTEKREVEKARKEAVNTRWTIAKLWDSYCENNPYNKIINAEKRKFDVHIRQVLGDKEPGQLLPLDVDRLRLGLLKKGHKTTAARVLEILRRTLNYGVKKGKTSPITFKIEIPRLNNQTTEDLTEYQIKSLLAVLERDEDQTTASIMKLALYTGMRRGEIFRLKWQDIDFERGFITIRNPKGGQDQSIPLNGSALAVLEKIEKAGSNGWIFPGQREGSHLTTLNRKSVDRIRNKAGLPVGFRPMHGLRHVYASVLASSGQVDLYTLQRLLTHKSPLMTQRYAHLRDDALKRASALAGDIINKPANKTSKVKAANEV